MENIATSSPADTVADEAGKRRYVFRLSVPTLKLLKAFCQGRMHGQQSRTIRKAMELFNQSETAQLSVRTWKLNSPRGASTVSVWAPVELVEAANARAEACNVSLNHYVEIAIRSMLSITGR
jgi:hypothetical protein